MTDLERLLLSNIFTAERHDGATYLRSDSGPSDAIDLPKSELVTALAASELITSAANTFVQERLASVGDDASELNSI